MSKTPLNIVIPKEDAVFWLDGQGRWHNDSGPFQHKKIIDYFHASIRRDAQGYYLYQTDDQREEKVYFRYEDTALFVFEVQRNESVVLVLNTGERMDLDPGRLFTRNDGLYQRRGDEEIKFAERSLIQMAELLEEEGGRLFIKHGGRRHPIENID